MAPTPSTLNFSAFKLNEIQFQDAKYRRQMPQMDAVLSILEFERRYLTPIHLGGSSRGLLLSRALNRLLERDVRGKRVLDYCCGTGFLGVYLARLGALVSAVDVSPLAIQCVQRRARANAVDIDARVGDCESLPFPNDTFDFLVGFEALHHVVIYPSMPRELARIAAPHAFIVFAENWGADNPLLALVRKGITMRANCSSARGEVVLGNSILRERLGGEFNYSVDAISMLYMLKRVLPHQGISRVLYRLDQLLPKFPALCGEAVITLTKR